MCACGSVYCSGSWPCRRCRILISSWLWQSFNAGATVVHVHFRDQRPGKGHLPSWDPEVAKACVDAIRERTPEIIVNLTTGTVGTKGAMGGGDLGPVDGPIKCIETTRPEMAALNSGSLNYLKVAFASESLGGVVCQRGVSQVRLHDRSNVTARGRGRQCCLTTQ